MAEGCVDSRMKKKRVFRSRILIFMVLFVVGVFAVSYFSAQAAINEKQAEHARLCAEYEELCAENAEKQARVDRGRDEANLEQLAREKYSYVYPDERVYLIKP